MIDETVEEYPIYSSAKKCSDAFDDLSASLRNSTSADNDPELEVMINVQKERFMNWATYLGVFAPPNASLDARLRNTSSVVDLILDHLSASQTILHLLLGWQKVAYTANEIDESSTPQKSNDDTESFSASHERDAESSKQLVLTLQGGIDKLYEISHAIRSSSSEARIERAARYVERDQEGNDLTELFKSYAFAIASHRFPNASLAIKDRLADAFVLRRRFLYVRSHQQKLSSRRQQPHNTEQTQLSTLATQNIVPNSAPQAGTSNAILNFAAPSDTMASVLVSSESPLNGDSIQATAKAYKVVLNNLPTSSSVRPGARDFMCPHCFLYLPKKDSTEGKWRRHLIEDLKPYCCLIEGCNEPSYIFSNRNSWFEHMKAHDPLWKCPLDSYISSSEAELLSHLQLKHEGRFSEAQVPALVYECQLWNPVSSVDCPLCDYRETSEETKDRASMLLSHIAIHLIQYALLALPWLENEDKDIFDAITASYKTGSVSVGEGSMHSNPDRDYIVFEVEGTPREEPYSKSYWHDLEEGPMMTYEEQLADPILQPFIQGRSTAVDTGQVLENLQRRGRATPEASLHESREESPPPSLRGASPTRAVVSDPESKKQGIFHIRACYKIFLSILLTIAGSTSLSLWWSFIHGDVSGGFTIGSYCIAAASLPIGFASYQHSKECRCWKKKPSGHASDLELERGLLQSRRP